jgi:quercetin 2,3-dioxygenase
VTYLFEGEILHTDSLDYRQLIVPGDVNWMTAGRGITHAEQALRTVPRMHGVQSWVGLPHDQRQTNPAFDHYAQDTLPVARLDGAVVRLLAGRLGDAVSPIVTFEELTYLDISAEAGCELEIAVDPGHELAVYVCEGAIEIGGRRIERLSLGKLSDGAERLRFSCAERARFVVFGGTPLPDPTVIYWNFVTDTLDEAKAAMAAWENGDFPVVGKYVKIAAPAGGDETEKMKLL